MKRLTHDIEEEIRSDRPSRFSSRLDRKQTKILPPPPPDRFYFGPLAYHKKTSPSTVGLEDCGWCAQRRGRRRRRWKEEGAKVGASERLGAACTRQSDSFLDPRRISRARSGVLRLWSSSGKNWAWGSKIYWCSLVCAPQAGAAAAPRTTCSSGRCPAVSEAWGRPAAAAAEDRDSRSDPGPRSSTRPACCSSTTRSGPPSSPTTCLSERSLPIF